MISESPLSENQDGIDAAYCYYRMKTGSKRQRTDSGSSGSSIHLPIAQDDIEVDTEGIQRAASPTGKNVRGAAARNHQNKELREREEKQQKDRLDAASKRKGRAERQDKRFKTEVLLLNRTFQSKFIRPTAQPSPYHVPHPPPPCGSSINNRSQLAAS